MFCVKVRSPTTHRGYTVYVVSENFEELKKKLIEEYGENLVSITWKNPVNSNGVIL